VARGQQSINVRVAGEYRTRAMGFIEIPIKINQAIDVPLPDMQAIERELTRQLQNQLQNQFQQGLDNLLR
jgi:hypothetical protein